MTQVLFFKASYERLQQQITKIAPELDVVLYDNKGRLYHHRKKVEWDSIDPNYFWIHSELYSSPRLEDYFQLVLKSPSAIWLHTINTGLDKLPYLELIQKGVNITNNHSQAIAIAEYVLAQVLACYQNICAQRENQDQKLWQGSSFREIQDSRWLIVGFGQIGKQIAVRAKAFGAFVATVRRKQETEKLANAVYTLDELKSALGVADVVVLACTSNGQTRGIVDADFLSRMKPDSVLVNIARGDLIVESALKEALEIGVPDRAILDVCNEEPPAPDSWLWDHPRIWLTPHSSNAGRGMIERSNNLFLENLERIIKGDPLLNLVSESDIV